VPPLFTQREIPPRAMDGGPWACCKDVGPGFSVLTLNVWFGEREQQARARAVAELIETMAPKVVALQEVTAPFLAVLGASRSIQERYWTSALTVDDYGTLLLSSLPVSELYVAEIGGSMGRVMPWGVVSVGSERVAIGAVHLESGRHNAETRAEQLVECFARLAPFEHAILLGDTNFADGEPIEERALTAEWVDGWRATQPAGEPGYTRDTVANPMAASLRNGDVVQRRIDRVLTRSTRFRASKSALVGTEPIAPGVYASDHFGLFVELDAVTRLLVPTSRA